MTILATGFLMLQGGMAYAQTEKNGEVSEIIIHQNGGQEKKITVIIDGDDVMINGKPMNEFNDKSINIRRRKIIINDGEPFRFRGWGNIGGSSFDINGDGFNMQQGRPGRQQRITINEDSITFLGVQTELSPKGAQIVEVVPGSAAELAGLEAEDIIVKIDKEIIDGPEALTDIIRAHQPNDNVEISFLRDGKKKKTKATLQSKVISTRTVEVNEMDEEDDAAPDNGELDQNGFKLDLDKILTEVDKKLKDMDIDLNVFPKKQKLGIKIQDTENEKGVRILEVADSSLALKAGLQKDDVITAIDGQAINNTDEARDKIHEMEDKSSYQIKFIRNKKEMQVTIKTPKELKTTDL